MTKKKEKKAGKHMKKNELAGMLMTWMQMSKVTFPCTFCDT